MNENTNTFVYTIGHSNLPPQEFVAILEHYSIKLVVDIRSHPKSRYNPHFNKDTLTISLNSKEISYIHLKKFGGFKTRQKDSLHTALASPCWQAYADFMTSGSFNPELKKLISIIQSTTSVLMCAEKLPENCHRYLLSDALVFNNINVHHIINNNTGYQHKFSQHISIKNNQLIYNKSGEEGTQLTLL